MPSKSLRFEGQIIGCSSKVDGSLGLRMATPELSAEEKASVMELQGLLLDVFLVPKDEKGSETVTVKSQMDLKTKSQRLRAVLHVLWRQRRDKQIFTGSFEEFYDKKMEQLIEWVKTNLDKK